MDFLLLQAVVRELRDCLPGARVTKVTQPASAVVVLDVRGPAWTGRLLLAAEPGASRIHTTETVFENPPKPPPLCQALRSALKGRRLGAPLLLGDDRVVALPFVASRSEEEPDEVTLVAELTGRQAALVLLRGPAPGGTVVQAVGTAGVTKGRLVAGAHYAPPPWPEGAAAFEDYTGTSLAEALSAPGLSSKPLVRRLVHVVMGLSPLAAEEVCHRAGLEPQAQTVDTDQARALLDATAGLAAAVREGPLSATLYRDPSGHPMAATPVPFAHLEARSKAEPMPSANAAAAAFAEARTETQRAVHLRQRLASAVDQALKKANRKCEKVREDLVKAQQAEHDRQCGSLLLANLGEVRRGMTSISLRNDFDPEGASIAIALDPAVSPQINAARYFKRSKKAKRSLGPLKRRLTEGEREVAYLDATRQAAALADEEAAEGLLEELEAGGFVPWQKRPPPRRRPRHRTSESAIRRFRATEGWEVLVGKNARGNDELTTRRTRPDDLWFHAHGIPGAHIVLRGESRADPPPEAVGWAAAAAAYFSQGRGDAKVRVDYTAAKNVTKPKGAKPGQVVIRWKKTLLVAPATSESLEEREVTPHEPD